MHLSHTPRAELPRQEKSREAAVTVPGWLPLAQHRISAAWLQAKHQIPLKTLLAPSLANTPGITKKEGLCYKETGLFGFVCNLTFLTHIHCLEGAELYQFDLNLSLQCWGKKLKI